MVNNELAHRHLLAVDGLEATLRSERQHIRIVVSEAWASSHSGQFLTSCLVNLLCRQVKLVGHVEVSAPRAHALIRLPNGDAADYFPACLQKLATWAVNGAVTVSATRTNVAADHTIFVGDAPSARRTDDGHVLVAVGDGWRAWVGSSLGIHPPVLPTSASPLGPFFAAALTAGEIFKRGRGIRRGRFLSADGYSLWSGVQSANWSDLDHGPTVGPAVLPPLHLVGSGAVGNAFAYILANLGLDDGYIVLIDDDSYDVTNLNRCLIAGWTDIGDPKVDAVARSLLAGRIGAFTVPKSIKNYAADARTGLRHDVATQVRNLIFEIVVSCVDKGVSRQDVQGLRPRLLLGGSTLDLQAKTNFYSGRTGAACLACFNPRERDGEKLRAIEAELRNMPPEELGQFLSDRGLDVRSAQDYLSGAQCGGFGEAAIRDFAIRPPPEFSAGFVSLGAGLLLATALLQKTVFFDTAPQRLDMTTWNFLNGRVADSGLGADDACEQRCQTRFPAVRRAQ